MDSNTTASSAVDGGNYTEISVESVMVRIPETAITYVTLNSVALASGVFGNLLILTTYLKSSTLRRPGSELTISLAVSDLFIAAFADPLCIAGVFSSENLRAKFSWLCEMIASICLAACLCSFYTIFLLTLHRYLYICWNKAVHKIKRGHLIAAVVFCWFLAIGIEFPNLIGAGGKGNDELCMRAITVDSDYWLLLGILAIMVPLAISGFMFGAIFIRIRKSHMSVMAHGQHLQDFNAPPSNSSANVSKISSISGGGGAGSKDSMTHWKTMIRYSRTLFIVFMAYVASWLPTAVVMIIGADKVPFEALLWASWMGHLHSSVNWIIYLVTNSNFCNAVRMLLSPVMKRFA